MFMTRLSPLVVGLLLAGCSGMLDVRHRAPTRPRRHLGWRLAASAAPSVYRTVSAAPTARPLGEAIRAESGAASMRVIRPGEAVTLDHRPDRLNVHLDETDTIAALDCG